MNDLMKGVHKLAYFLLLVGGLNWGLVGLFNFNLVMALFGSWPMFEKLIYILVGLSAVSEGMSHMELCRECGMEMMKPMMKKKGRK